MKRIFPTQLKVVDAPERLSQTEEAKKGYFDEASSSSIEIGVRKNRIYLSAPDFWYRSYVFSIDLATIPKMQGPIDGGDDDNSFEEGQVSTTSISASVIGDNLTDTQRLWKIIACVVKTECGRKVIHKNGDTVIRVHGINKTQAKQIYYLFKHVLHTKGISYTLASSWRAAPKKRFDAPEIREKPPRRRRKRGQDWVLK